MFSIEEKPLVRAAFLLCKKVQVFVRRMVMHPFAAHLCNLGKREQFACIMNSVERYKNLYFCDCA